MEISGLKIGDREMLTVLRQATKLLTHAQRKPTCTPILRRLPLRPLCFLIQIQARQHTPQLSLPILRRRRGLQVQPLLLQHRHDNQGCGQRFRVHQLPRHRNARQRRRHHPAQVRDLRLPLRPRIRDQHTDHLLRQRRPGRVRLPLRCALAACLCWCAAVKTRQRGPRRRVCDHHGDCDHGVLPGRCLLPAQRGECARLAAAA